MSSEYDSSHRVLIFAPTGRDAELACAVLESAAIPAAACPDMTSFCRELEAGASAGILTEAALHPDRRAALVEMLATQPLWADFPLIVLAPRSRGEDARIPLETALRELGNTTLLERPLHPESLLSAVRAALRARHRQYQSRELLERLEQAVDERDRFLATLSHELRNPLGAMHNAAHLIRRLVRHGSPMERPLTIVDRQITHLTRLIDDLLDVSRVTTGKIILAKDEVDLKGVIQQAVLQLESEFAQQGLYLLSALGSLPLCVTGDAVRLEQVITNLLTNSLKYTPEGGRVEVSAGRDGDDVWVNVVDNGIGIDASTLPSIFDMFCQADRSLDRSKGGMGIGLTLAKNLVERHGGTIAARSAGLGHGSEFTVRLPVAEQSSRAASVPARRPIPKHTGQRVLLIEDNDDNRELMRELLEADGFRVEVARDGSEGVQRALESKPDVAIVDIGLPVLDGYEVARQVRAALGSKIQLVALTGYGQPDDRDRTTEAGFDTHLTKPVALEDLEIALAQCAGT